MININIFNVYIKHMVMNIKIFNVYIKNVVTNINPFDISAQHTLVYVIYRLKGIDLLNFKF